MPSVYRHKDQWRAQVRTNGRSVSKLFTSKREAIRWSKGIESNIDRHPLSGTEKMTLREALERYRDTVTTHKKGWYSESYKIGKWLRHPFASYRLVSIRSTDIVAYRDERVREGASSSTIKNNLGIISQVYRVASTEWGLEGLNNPVTGVRMPPSAPYRETTLSEDEEEAVLAVSPEWLKPLVILAVETGMRQGELLSLRKDMIRGKTIYLGKTKNGRSRSVPLSPRARQQLASLPEQGLCFKMSRWTVRNAWMEVCEKVGLDDIHWHDLRSVAISRMLSRGLNHFQIMQAVGHSSTTIMARYARWDAEALADLL